MLWLLNLRPSKAVCVQEFVRRSREIRRDFEQSEIVDFCESKCEAFANYIHSGVSFMIVLIYFSKRRFAWEITFYLTRCNTLFYRDWKRTGSIREPNKRSFSVNNCAIDDVVFLLLFLFCYLNVTTRHYFIENRSPLKYLNSCRFGYKYTTITSVKSSLIQRCWLKMCTPGPFILFSISS